MFQLVLEAKTKLTKLKALKLYHQIFGFLVVIALLVTSHCTLCAVVGGVIRRVVCTWRLLGLAVKEPWLALSGSIPVLVAQTGLENTTLTFLGVHFWHGRWLGL